MKTNESLSNEIDDCLRTSNTAGGIGPVIFRYVLAFAAALPLAASAQLAPDTAHAIDALVIKALEDKAVPSVSIAIVKDGKLEYAQAYGMARIDPALVATPQMRYKIGSNTKQFVAAAMLLLVEDGKISLDDKVGRFLPELTRANEITVRQLLSHTAGYPDYFPLDYVAPFIEKPTTADAILAKWGRQALSYEPGSKWEYSNTGYTIAGRIIEIASGMPLNAFIQSRITAKLGLHSAIDITTTPWEESDPQGYAAAAFGPPRPATLEGKNWLWAVGNLAMTASDLARWDMALMRGTLLKTSSRKAMTTENLLTNGTGTNYGLGLFVRMAADGRLRWEHSGEVSGFCSQNVMFPNDDAAIVVLANTCSPISKKVAGQIESLLFPASNDPATTIALKKVRTLLVQLQTGHPDRSLMSEGLSAYFNEQAVSDFAASLKPLGDVESVTETRSNHRGGLVYRLYQIKMAGGSMWVTTYFTPDGKLDQFLVYPR